MRTRRVVAACMVLTCSIVLATAATQPLSHHPPTSDGWFGLRLPTTLVEAGRVQFGTDEERANEETMLRGLRLEHFGRAREYSDGPPRRVELAALAALSRMTSGFVQINGTDVTISGTAPREDTTDIINALKSQLPPQFRVEANLRAPKDENYWWAASKFVGT